MRLSDGGVDGRKDLGGIFPVSRISRVKLRAGFWALRCSACREWRVVRCQGGHRPERCGSCAQVKRRRRCEKFNDR